MDLELARSLLDYNPKTGAFTWKEAAGVRLAGKRAGSFNERTNMYRIGLFGLQYNGGHMAIFLMTGEMSRCRIRFRDGNHANLRLANLEIVADQTKRGPERVRPERKPRQKKGDAAAFA